MNTQSKKVIIPLSKKPLLSVAEASDYSGIGRDKLYELTSRDNCPFVFWVENHRMIKREKFEEFIEKSYSI